MDVWVERRQQAWFDSLFKLFSTIQWTAVYFVNFAVSSRWFLSRIVCHLFVESKANFSLSNIMNREDQMRRWYLVTVTKWKVPHVIHILWCALNTEMKMKGTWWQTFKMYCERADFMRDCYDVLACLDLVRTYNIFAFNPLN